MSYDIHLTGPVTGEVLTLDVPHHMRGGTYAVGGSPDASLNITYNYVGHFRRTLGEKGTGEFRAKCIAAAIRSRGGVAT